VNLQKTKSSLTSAVILTALLTTVQFPTAQAATVGSNQCVQTVNSNSGVSVYQDSGSCFIAFKSATTYTWTPPSTLREIDLLVVGGHCGHGVMGMMQLLLVQCQGLSASRSTATK
jgi:hypothetical protein